MASLPCIDLEAVRASEIRPGDTLFDPSGDYIAEEDGTVSTSPRGGTALTGELYGVTEVNTASITVQPLNGAEPLRLRSAGNIEALRVLQLPAEVGR